VGPDFKRPAASVEPHWIEEPSAPSPLPNAATANWWQVFADPTLDALIDAITTTVVAGRRRPRAAGPAQLQVAIGQLFPQQQALSAEVQHQRLSRDSLLTTAADPSLRSSQIGLAATWELDFWASTGAASNRSCRHAGLLAAYDNAW
jgi:outer membrane protein TolC